MLAKKRLVLADTFMGATSNTFVGQASDEKTPTPDEAASVKEYWDIVRAALNPKQFEIVQMYFRESLTQEDIAERLDIPRKTISNIINGSLEKLKTRAGNKLENAIPAARKPRISGHRALHAYEMAIEPDVRDSMNIDLGAEDPNDQDEQRDLKYDHAVSSSRVENYWG